MKKLLSALFALALCSSMALATVPYPPNCTVSPWDGYNGVVLCPDTPGSPIGQSVGTLTVRNQANNPIANAAVIISFLATGPFCFCSDMVYSTTTNGSGMATLTLRGGGCVRGTDGAALIRANGVQIRDYYNAKSPDWDGVAGNCTVSGPDAVRFAMVPKDLCFDFDNSGSVDIGDYVVFTSGLTASHNCP
jgi:hypothetical protein